MNEHDSEERTKTVLKRVASLDARARFFGIPGVAAAAALDIEREETL